MISNHGMPPTFQEKLLQKEYAFSEQEVKITLPSQRYLSGLFNVINRLFKLVVKPDLAPVW